MSEVLKINVYLQQEKEIVTNLKKQMRGKLFIDVGAFIGEYSINLADSFEEIWAFEPATDARECLEENIKKLDIKNIHVFKEALSDQEGEGTLYSTRSRMTGETGLKRYGRYQRELEKVKTTTLDTLTGEREVDLMKIDTEGHEIQVLKGSKETLKRTKKVIVEIHAGVNVDKVSAILKELGFAKMHFGSWHLFAERE